MASSYGALCQRLPAFLPGHQYARAHEQTTSPTTKLTCSPPHNLIGSRHSARPYREFPLTRLHIFGPVFTPPACTPVSKAGLLRTGPRRQTGLARKWSQIRGAVQEPPPLDAPQPMKDGDHRNKNSWSESDLPNQGYHNMAPTPSPLNLLMSPRQSKMSLNLGPRKLAPELIWIPSAEEDPVAYNVLGLTANAYLLLIGRQAVAVDATSPFVIPLLKTILVKERVTLRALLLTHHHIAAAGKPKGQGVKQFRKAFPQVPIFLHPIDAKHEDALLTGVAYQNPLGSALLDSLGIECWLFPGHTQGHVQYYLEASGGSLCTGDTAVGAPVHRSAVGRDKMSRAPVHLNEDDAEVARRWADFLRTGGRAVSTICPYHGKAYGNETPGRVDYLLTPLKSSWPTIVP